MNLLRDSRVISKLCNELHFIISLASPEGIVLIRFNVIDRLPPFFHAPWGKNTMSSSQFNF